MTVDVYTWGLPRHLEQRIEAIGGRVRTLDDPPAGRPGVMFWTPGFPRDRIDELLASHPEISWVHSIGAGADHTIPRIPEHLVLTRGPGPAGGPVGEFAVMAVLMLARRVPELFTHHQARRFQKTRGVRFDDLHVTVLGYGPIGQVVTRCLSVLGATVDVVRRTPDPGATPTQHPTHALPEVLARSNGLVAACALTRETTGIIDRAMLRALPEGGFLVNVARGGIVDHQALADLLHAGHLSGAVLDTTEPEPLPTDHTLWEAPGCLITSHTAAYAGDFLAEAVDLFCDNLRRFMADEPLPYVVDRQRGY